MRTGGDCSAWELSPSLAVPMKAGEMDAYVGAGLSVARVSFSFPGFSSSSSETGINVLGGLKLTVAGRPAFVEARFGLGGADQLAVSFGMLFGGTP